MSTSEAWLKHIMMVYADEQSEFAIGGCLQECHRVFREAHRLSGLGNDLCATSMVPCPFPPPFVDSQHHVTCFKKRTKQKLARSSKRASEVIIDVPSINLCNLRRTVSFQPFSPAQNYKPPSSRRPHVPHDLLSANPTHPYSCICLLRW